MGRIEKYLKNRYEGYRRFDIDFVALELQIDRTEAIKIAKEYLFNTSTSRRRVPVLTFELFAEVVEFGIMLLEDVS